MPAGSLGGENLENLAFGKIFQLFMPVRNRKQMNREKTKAIKDQCYDYGKSLPKITEFEPSAFRRNLGIPQIWHKSALLKKLQKDWNRLFSVENLSKKISDSNYN